MADEDKEKAEKVAAAKKRYEQLKKQKQKEGKKGGTKKSESKTSTESKAEDATENAQTKDASEATTTAVDGEDADASTKPDDSAADPRHSKQRSESFRHSGPVNPQGEVQELYRKQAVRIEELEKENKAFREQQEEGAARLVKAEEDLESLREGNSDLAALKSKAKDADRLSDELASVQRQLVQAQQATKGGARRISGTNPDLSEQLTSKTLTIESLELEVSNLRNQVNGLTETASEREDSFKDAEERVTAAEAATQAAKQELDALKVSIAFPSDETKAANEDPEALTKRITVLESDLRSAKSDIDAASQRAKNLQQKLEALTKLHRNVTATSQTKDKELADLRNQIRRRDRPSHVRDVSEFDLQDDETETGELQARIRALEAENFDLRRGIWHEKRAEMQGGNGDGSLPEYEDVDLNSPYTPRSSSLSRPAHSTFQDVINSGISAFTGRPRDFARNGSSTTAGRPRKQSLGLLSEDGFDEEAFLLAQEEEGKRRIERVKEVKRGLDQWKGWRIDLVDLRQGGGIGGREVGPVFEV